MTLNSKHFSNKKESDTPANNTKEPEKIKRQSEEFGIKERSRYATTAYKNSRKIQNIEKRKSTKFVQNEEKICNRGRQKH